MRIHIMIRMIKMTKDEIKSLKTADIESLILFALYKMRDIPEYSTLCELAYTLDRKSFFKFLDYFGGMTLKVPASDEFLTVVNALLLYCYIELEDIEYSKALKMLNKSEQELRDISNTYIKLCDILDKYDFKRS